LITYSVRFTPLLFCANSWTFLKTVKTGEIRTKKKKKINTIHMLLKKDKK